MTTIIKKNEVYIKVHAEPHVHQELADHFCFDVPGAKYMPHYRNHVCGMERFVCIHQQQVRYTRVFLSMSQTLKAERIYLQRRR